MAHSRRFAAAVALATTVCGLCCLTFSCGLTHCGPRSTTPRRLLLVTIDTLRADRLGCYGGGRALTPHIDRLAYEGAVLEQVIVPVPRTSQSIASLMTGLHPIHHGVRGLFWRLSEDRGRTLAEVLSNEGFQTGALTSNLVLRAGQGFERGFSMYDNPPPRWEKNGANEIVQDALDWIGRAGDQPWFLWIHLLDPHWSYEPSPPFDAFAGGLREEDRDLFRDIASGRIPRGEIVFGNYLDGSRQERMRLLYDGEVRATDAAIGRLVDGMSDQGLLDGTLLVLTADHGEALGEHGYRFAHGETLYEETVRVPTIVIARGTVPAGRRLRRLIRNYDLMPTALELLGVSPPSGIDGISRAAELRGSEEKDNDREIYAESDRQYLLSGNPKRFLPGYEGSWRALRNERFKLIRIPRPGGDLMEIYDLRTDPREERDLFASTPPESASMAERLADHQAAAAGAKTEAGAQTPPAVPPGTALDEERRILTSLGYAAEAGSRAPPR